MPKLTSFIELNNLMHSLLHLAPCPPMDYLSIASARSVSIFSEVLRGALQGIKEHLVKKKTTDGFKKSYNVCVDPEPMYHVIHAQMSRQNGGIFCNVYFTGD